MVSKSTNYPKGSKNDVSDPTPATAGPPKVKLNIPRVEPDGNRKALSSAPLVPLTMSLPRLASSAK